MRLGTWTTNTVELSGTFGDPLVARRRIAGGPQTGPHYDTTRVKNLRPPAGLLMEIAVITPFSISKMLRT